MASAVARFRIVVNEPLPSRPARARAVARFHHVETTSRGTVVVYTTATEPLMEFTSVERFLETFGLEPSALVEE
jgi:hypothetical protein